MCVTVTSPRRILSTAPSVPGASHVPAVPSQDMAGAGRGDNECISLSALFYSGGVRMLSSILQMGTKQTKEMSPYPIPVPSLSCCCQALLKWLSRLPPEISDAEVRNNLAQGLLLSWRSHTALLHFLSSGEPCGPCQHSPTNLYHAPAWKIVILKHSQQLKPSNTTEH